MTHPIKCGVPLGFILGTLLFTIYVNNICNKSIYLFNIMHADDTSVLLSGKNCYFFLINKELDLLSIWLNQINCLLIHKLPFNFSFTMQG